MERIQTPLSPGSATGQVPVWDEETKRYEPGAGAPPPDPDGGVPMPFVRTGIRVVNKSSTGALSVADIFGTVVTNFGQEAEAHLTLPSIAEVIAAIDVDGIGIETGFILQVRTGGAGALGLVPAEADKHYFDDGTKTVVPLNNGEAVVISDPVMGDTLVVTLIQTGPEKWDWLTTCPRGAAVRGGS